MDDADITRYITDTFGGVDIVLDDGNRFFFYDPGQDLPADHRFPFVTLVINDKYDSVSNLSRPSVFRLNIGISKAAYLAIFESQPLRPGPEGIVDTGHDFTTLDQIMPHPVYATAFWICVLNPSDATFEIIRPLLAEAYQLAADMYAKRAAHQ